MTEGKEPVTHQLEATVKGVGESSVGAPGLGDEAGSYLVRITLRKAHPSAGAPPELMPLEGAIEAAMLTRFPDFSPSAHAERLDK